MIYDGYVHFEVEIACSLLKSVGEVITVGVDKGIKGTRSGFNVVPDITLDQLDLNEVDAFIIPGGLPDTEELKDSKLYEVLGALNEKKTVIGAICAAPYHLAKAGVLQGKQYTTTLEPTDYDVFNADNFVNKDVVIQDNVVTATGSAYVEFAMELFDMTDNFESKDEKTGTMKFFKNQI